MGQNLFYNELNARQVYLEIIKRFPEIEYNEEQLTMVDIFGKEWRLLDEDAKEQAEQWFCEVISDKSLKGIIYEMNTQKEYFYKRIPSDKFQK